MFKGQKSVRGGIEDFLCPFTDMYITQGSNGQYSHQGIMANDVRGIQPGVRYPYYAPCTIKCISVYAPYGESRWQSLKPVRFANGRVSHATFEIAHDSSQNCYVGQVIEQGTQLGNMGDAGRCTGVHCHIQVSQSKDSSYYRNSYGNLMFNNEYDLDDCYFVDNTNIIQGMGGNWKTIDKVPVQECYKTKFNMRVRSGAGLNFNQVKVNDLTTDGKAHATSQDPNANAVYKEGTVFTAIQIITNGDSVWAKSPSGYICIKDSETVYCEKC